MDEVSLIRLAQVHPKLQNLAKEMDVYLASQGIQIRVVQGFRTFKQQADLYAQGRTTPGHIVTDAPPGYGYHEYGTAIDCVPGIRGSTLWQPNWNIESPDYPTMVRVGTGLGLVSGSTWKLRDWPHFQLGGELPVSPTDEMRSCLEQKGLQAFWAEFVK